MTQDAPKRYDVDKKVLDTYQKVNPSTYQIEHDPLVFESRRRFMHNLFLFRLQFPPKMFQDTSLLEFGTGTGEHSLFFLQWGARCTFVEMNHLACQRAEGIFRTFAPEHSHYTIQNQSLFDFQSAKKYDITLSIGTLHHTHDKARAFDKQAAFLKEGGFTILGIGNAAGAFQRNLQRLILYSFATHEDHIVSLANELFSEHLDRAEKFGKRTREAIIWDSYINPKVDFPEISEVLQWFKKHDITLYSSWPPVIPAILGDSAQREVLDYESFPHLLTFPEFFWMIHAQDDCKVLDSIDEHMKKKIEPFQDMVMLLNDMKPDLPPDLKRVIYCLSMLKKVRLENDPYQYYLASFEDFLHETEEVLVSLHEKNLERLKNALSNSRILFRGTCGLGINYYVGHKAV